MHEALEEGRNYWPSKDVYAEQVFYEKMVDQIEDAVDTIQLFKTELETTDLIPDADYKELSRILMDLELKLEDMK
jgi:FtsZ-binding cell division protein ZapB